MVGFQGIKINEAAARTDISRINNAIPILEQAKAALMRVREQGEATKGETGKAIVEKSTELIKRIDKLLKSLRETSKEISETVRLNQMLDIDISNIIKF